MVKASRFDKRRRVKDLVVYQRMMELVKLVYTLTDVLPKTEEFGLKSQMRRASVSVIACFTEGYMRKSRKDKLHYLEMSETSHDELDTEGDVCQELGYWSSDDWDEFLRKSAEVSYLAYRYKHAVLGS